MASDWGKGWVVQILLEELLFGGSQTSIAKKESTGILGAENT